MGLFQPGPHRPGQRHFAAGAVLAADRSDAPHAAVYLGGEYGINNLFIGVPVKLGEKGAEQVIEIELTKDESKALHASAAAVQGLVDDIKRLG